jgi:MinD superfamily P-loop ATPase
VDFCAFNALALIGKRLMIFDEICHSCGGCIHVCPQKALSEQDRAVGEMSIGRSDSVRSISGSMNIGESSGVPIIEELLKHKGEDLTIIDAPPGSSCLVTESVRLADFCILIAEPTTFGAHNLAMVHELVSLLGKPYAVVLNKVMEGKNPAEEFCIKNNIPIIGRIPFDKKLGSLNSVGKIASREEKHYRELFASILSKALAKVNP